MSGLAMGAWCRDLEPAGVINGVPGNHFELADQTGTTSIQTLATPAKYFRCVIYVKQMTGTGTASISFVLQAGSSSSTGVGGMAGQVLIDPWTFTGSAGSWTYIMHGFVPDQAPRGFVRLGMIGSPVPGTFLYDCIIDGL